MGHMVFEVRPTISFKENWKFQGRLGINQRDLFDVRRRVLDPIIKPSERH